MMTVVNIIGGPGSGKSTAAAGLFYNLKKLQLNCELSLEWVKSKVYEESFKCMEDQMYIFAKQNHKLFILKNKVDLVVTDCTLLNSLVYGEHNETFERLVIEQFKRYNNINFLIRRKQAYQTQGRVENRDEAERLDIAYKRVLDMHNIPYIECDNIDACDVIMKELIKQGIIK
jgi:nicotinamide riboside kinase